MKNSNNLTKKIYTGLGALVLGTIIGGGICYSKEINTEGYELPDLSNASFIGAVIRGENKIEHYKLINPERRVSIASVNDETFLYGIRSLDTREYYALADMNGDGIFETKYNENELRCTDKSKKEFSAKKDFPPEWVFPPEWIL